MNTYKKNCCVTLFTFLLSFNVSGQSLAEQLGYSSEAKLLIIHADDVGVAHSENMGSIKAMEVGSVNSASIMMPCPWVAEIATYAQKNPEADFGLHLTLTSEWETMKWSPLASKNEVKSLINEFGFFYADCEDFQKNAKIAEVELELRAQITQAYNLGIKPTHLDSHMGCLIYNPDLLNLYLKLGKEYKIPAMIDKASYKTASAETKALVTDKNLLLEKVITAYPTDFKSGMVAYYKKVLSNLVPGVQILLIHTAYNDAEMQALTINHPEWGAQWRQDDLDFFTSEACRQLLKEQDIQLVTWREIQKAIYKK